MSTPSRPPSAPAGSLASLPQGPQRTAPPRDMFGGRMIGGLGMPTQKATQ